MPLLPLEEKLFSVSMSREPLSKLQQKCMQVLFISICSNASIAFWIKQLFLPVFFPSWLCWNRAASQPSLCYGKQALLVSCHLISFPCTLNQCSHLLLNWGCSENFVDPVQTYSYCHLNEALKQQKYFSVSTRNASPDPFSSCIYLFPWPHHSPDQSFGSVKFPV